MGFWTFTVCGTDGRVSRRYGDYLYQEDRNEEAIEEWVSMRRSM